MWALVCHMCWGKDGTDRHYVPSEDISGPIEMMVVEALILRGASDTTESVKPIRPLKLSAHSRYRPTLGLCMD